IASARLQLGTTVSFRKRLNLCAGTHDHSDISFSLLATPITVEPECWIAARAFVGGPGVRIGRGAVIGACSVLLSDAPAATIVAIIPARTFGIRHQNSYKVEAPSVPEVSCTGRQRS